MHDLTLVRTDSTGHQICSYQHIPLQTLMVSRSACGRTVRT